jgi:crossover junction endodeoxyribonuclease RusA
MAAVMVGVMEVTLPWPPRELSPNGRHHWATKARATKKYRAACGWQAIADGVKPNHRHSGPISVHMVFVPPTRRIRDEGNLVAWMKAGLDGLADALGIDDSEFRLTHELDRVNLGGMVKVSIGTP